MEKKENSKSNINEVQITVNVTLIFITALRQNIIGLQNIYMRSHIILQLCLYDYFLFGTFESQKWTTG